MDLASTTGLAPSSGQIDRVMQNRHPLPASAQQTTPMQMGPAHEPVTARLIDNGLASTPEDANAIILHTKNRMSREASKSAAIQGVMTYARSFGAFGVMSRLAGQSVALANSPMADAVTNTVTSSSLPLSHSKAAATSGPTEAGTKFVKTANTQNLRPNFIGNAFRPFMVGLGIGNTVVGGSSMGAGALGLNKQVNSGLTNAALLIPGALSAVHTVRNVFAEQAKAGFSLQEPLLDDTNDLVGNIVTHQAPIPKEDQTSELGIVTVRNQNTEHKVSIRQNYEGQISTVVESTDGAAPAAAQSLITTAGKAVTNFATGTAESIRNAFTTSKDAVKVGSMVSTMAAAQAFTNFAGPAIKSALQAKGISESNAHLATTAVNTIVTNVLLSVDFIPKFMTHGQPTETNTDGAKKAAAALVPIVGGAAAFATRNADLEAARLSAETFDGLAEKKSEMLAGLSSLDDELVRVGEDGLTINIDALRNYVETAERSV